MQKKLRWLVLGKRTRIARIEAEGPVLGLVEQPSFNRHPDASAARIVDSNLLEAGKDERDLGLEFVSDAEAALFEVEDQRRSL